MTPPPEARDPRRIVVPGSDPEPAGAKRIVIPGAGEPAAEEPSRIVLPPGSSAAPSEDLPEYPRLRPLALVPVSDGQRELLVVTDPLGITPGQPVLSLASLGLIQLMDGTNSLTDISAAVMRESKDLRMGNLVRDFVAQLDELLMLDSPRFHRAHQALRDAYHPLEIRQSVFDGRSYPTDREELVAFLDEHFTAARPSNPAPPEAPGVGSLPRALLAPHLDPRRAGPTIARAIREIAPARPADGAPLRVVVFGTGHSLIGDLFALTRKHFETPLGKVRCDTAFVDEVASRLGPDAYRAELAHRDEHSIEFQAVYLAHHLRNRPFEIVPILCGGFHGLLEDGHTPRDAEEFEALVEAVRAAERSLPGPTVYLAGVDLSHVGPRFGDPAADERTRAEVESRDREAIEAARRGDADGWFQAIAAHEDSTRICGFAPTYAMLRCAEPGEGRLLQYERSDEKDSSFVTIASMAWA